MIVTKGNGSLNSRIQLGLIKLFWVKSRSYNLCEYKVIDNKFQQDLSVFSLQKPLKNLETHAECKCFKYASKILN